MDHTVLRPPPPRPAGYIRNPSMMLRVKRLNRVFQNLSFDDERKVELGILKWR